MIEGDFDFGALVKAVRAHKRANGWRSAEAARRVGLSKATMHRFLAAQIVGVGTVLKLCRWLDRDPYEFMDADWRLTDANGSGSRVASDLEGQV